MWVQWIFSVACLAVGGYFAVALFTRRGDPLAAPGGLTGAEYELSHLGMALGMAAMFAPVGDPVPRLGWVVIFGTAAAWFASRALQGGLQAGSVFLGHHGAVGYHLVANLAMLFMLISPHHHHGTTSSVGGPSGHEGHASAAGGGWLDGPLGTVLTVVLIGYFAVHAGRSLFRRVAAEPTRLSTPPAGLTGGAVTAPGAVAGGAVTAPGAVAVATRRRTGARPWMQPCCHGVMDVAMTVMFGLMLWP